MILSALSPSELCGVISSGNDKLLKTVKGIGLKTAQRIIVDLKDKIASSGMETVNSEMFASAANSEIHDEAVAALTMLGFAQAASQKVVAAILKEEPSAPVEKVIKLALKKIIKREVWQKHFVVVAFHVLAATTKCFNIYLSSSGLSSCILRVTNSIFSIASFLSFRICSIPDKIRASPVNSAIALRSLGCITVL